ncbi:Lrp/AsnC family transcriptional regulator [Pseudaestuariivita atlantica]|uniref:AsnC family transcriptional regulator n=1 Tax=Pseudaestuariivita atlantica TaxID=1317121 RepID=A0A0L1JRC0_9RHOB|nr:Lrp/AsnC family transcriptional regulator [Pseudaestuariivita atlantica]KNG94262.1 hypothetical protein ATO11_08605 [Pseudaestuariivita atlantica]
METQTLSEPDRALLRQIQRDCTLPVKDLAEAVGMSPSTAWRRMQDFERQGLIRARVALLDAQALGLDVTMQVSVNIRSQTEEGRAAFERFVRVEDAVQRCLAVTGEQDYILLVRMRDVAAFERFLMERLLAHPSVASAHSQLVLREVKSGPALPV